MSGNENRMRLKNFIVAFIVLIISQSAVAASFDCAKTKSKTEKVICSDKRLNELDSELDRNLNAIKEKYSKRMFRLIIQEHRIWVDGRNRFCRGNLECLSEETIKRNNFFIDALNPKYGHLVYKGILDTTSKPLNLLQTVNNGSDFENNTMTELTPISTDLLQYSAIDSCNNCGREPFFYFNWDETPIGGNYFCTERTELVSIEKNRVLSYGDVFNTGSKKIIRAIKLYGMPNNVGAYSDKELSETFQRNISPSGIVFVNKNEFNIRVGLHPIDNCGDYFYEKPLPISILMPFLTEYMKKQLIN